MTADSPKSATALKGPYAAALFVAMTLFVVIVGAITSLPSALAAEKDLRQAYGSTKINIVTLKTNNLEESCGFYKSATSPKSWRYLENRQGLYAEELSKHWRLVGENSQETSHWTSCMNRIRWGRGSFLYPLDDFVAMTLVRLL